MGLGEACGSKLVDELLGKDKDVLELEFECEGGVEDISIE